MEGRASAPLVIDRFVTGLYTHRSPLFTPFRQVGISVSPFRDALIDGLNIEHSDNYTLQRRPGFPRYCAQGFAAGEWPLNLGSFRNLSGTVYPLVDTQNALYTFGQLSLAPILTKSTTSQGFWQEVGNKLYYTNGTDVKKWDGTTVTNWGIQAPSAAPKITSTGNGAFWQPNFAGGGGAYIILDPNGFFQKTPAYNITGANQPIWNTVVGGTTVDNTTLWTNRGPFAGWAPATVYTLGSIISDSNGNLQEVTTAGTSGATTPAWATTIGGTTTDNTVTWTLRGIGFYNPVSQSGPAYAGTVTQSGFEASWTNINNVKAADGAYATATLNVGNGDTSNNLLVTNLGFAIPGGATISGIRVEIGRYASRVSTVQDVYVQLLKASAITGTPKALSTFWGANFVNAQYGTSGDMWGATLAPADINATGFGVVLSVGASNNPNFSVNANVDYIRVTVYYYTGTPPTAGTGQITARAGYQYAAVYHTTSGHVSTASAPTYTTGQIIGQFGIVLSVPGSADTQCDTVDFYRTADGGALFYYLGSSANGVGNVTFTDNAIPDNSLNNQLIAPQNHLNDQPPSGGSQIAFWQGRLWMAVGNYVYFNAGGDAVNGVPEEAWPPANVFTFPGMVTSLAPTSQGLLVFTSDAWYVILGGPQTLTFYPQHVQDNFGVSSPNCITVDGDQVFVYTTSKQLFSVSPSGRSETGWNIGDLLRANFNPTTAYISLYRNGEDSGLYLSDGNSRIARFGLNANTWSTLAGVVAGVGAIGNVETSLGNYSLIAGRSTGSGFLLYRNTSNFTDDGVSYQAYATIGSVTLSQPGALLVPVWHVLGYFTAVGSVPSVSVMWNEISPTAGQGFINLPTAIPEPPIGADASATVLAYRWPTNMNKQKKSQMAHHVQIKYTFASEAKKNEILAAGLKFDND